MTRQCSVTLSVSTRKNTTVSSRCSSVQAWARSVFIKAHFFGRQFRVLTEDKNLVEYYTRLSSFHAQYRAVGNNYNQVVKELRCHFSEKKAMALLYKLEKCTMELVSVTREIIRLTEEYKSIRQASEHG